MFQLHFHVFIPIIYGGGLNEIIFLGIVGQGKKQCTFAAAFETQKHTFEKRKRSCLTRLSIFFRIAFRKQKSVYLCAPLFGGEINKKKFFEKLQQRNTLK